MEWYWYLLMFIWYLSGSLGGLKIAKRIHNETSRSDYFVLFTIGGFLGLVNVIIGLFYLYEYKRLMTRVKKFEEEEKDKYS